MTPSPKNDGGNAFPRKVAGYINSNDPDALYFERLYSGMSMRQAYKLAAIQGNIRDRNKSFKDYAEDAGKMADAMIAEDFEFEKSRAGEGE